MKQTTLCYMERGDQYLMLHRVKKANDAKYRGIVTFVSDIWPCEYMHLFTASDWSGEETACNEGELAWIDKSRLFDLTLWEGDKIFLRLLMDPAQPFFSLKLVYRGDDLVEAKLDGRPLNLQSM